MKEYSYRVKFVTYDDESYDVSKSIEKELNEMGKKGYRLSHKISRSKYGNMMLIFEKEEEVNDSTN